VFWLSFAERQLRARSNQRGQLIPHPFDRPVCSGKTNGATGRAMIEGVGVCRLGRQHVLATVLRLQQLTALQMSPTARKDFGRRDAPDALLIAGGPCDGSSVASK
jgi:hypothetical protein